MRHRPRHVLPDPVRLALIRLGLALKSGAWLSDALDKALAQLAGLPPEVVVRADREIAEAAQLLHGSSTHRSLLAQTPRLERVFIFHRDGRLREAALRQLDGTLESAFLVAAVALRLNDWVAPVRAAAVAAAERVLPRTEARNVARASLFLIGRKEHWQRWGKEPAVIATALTRPDVVQALVELFRDGEFGGLAATLRQALRRPGMDDRLFELATRARQPVVRATALKTLIQGSASWIVGFEKQWIDKVYNKSRRHPVLAERDVARPVSLSDLITLGLGDRSPAVRRVAADGTVQHRATLLDVEEFTRLLLADGSQAVRGRGEFLIRERNRIGVRQS